MSRSITCKWHHPSKASYYFANYLNLSFHKKWICVEIIKHLCTCLNEVEATVIGNESCDLLAVLDELHPDTLADSGVGLLSLHSNLLQNNALGVRGTSERVGLQSSTWVSLLVIFVMPSLISAMGAQLASCPKTSWLSTSWWQNKYKNNVLTLIKLKTIPSLPEQVKVTFLKEKDYINPWLTVTSTWDSSIGNIGQFGSFGYSSNILLTFVNTLKIVWCNKPVHC